MPDPLLTFNGDGDDIPLMLALSRADSTGELLVRSQERRLQFRSLDRMYERMDGDGICEGDLDKVL